MNFIAVFISVKLAANQRFNGVTISQHSVNCQEVFSAGFSRLVSHSFIVQGFVDLKLFL